jgi:hypothetical protein
VNIMISQLDNVCPCFGRQLRRLRDEPGTGLGKPAEPTGTATGARDEIERGLRAVCSEWVCRVDDLLDGDGVPALAAGHSLHCHTWGGTGICTDFAHEGTGPIRLPAAFTMSAGQPPHFGRARA